MPPTNRLRAALAGALIALLPAAASGAPVHHATVPASVRGVTPVSYGAPAGNIPAGHLRGAAFDAVLPSGRIVTPLGSSVLTGVDALGVALSPDGRYAIVTNDDERHPLAHAAIDAAATGGSSLAVVELASMRVVDRYHAANETYWVGIAAFPDPANPARTLVLASGGEGGAVYAFDLDANGRLVPDAKHVIATQAAAGTIVVARDGGRAYVVDQAAGTVSAIDTASRTPSGAPQPVGFAPFGAALAGDRLLVTDEGLMRYAPLAQPAVSPPFRTVPADPQHASALSFLALTPAGDLAPAPPGAAPFANAALALDAAPDGVRIAGGAHPSAVVTTSDGGYAFVAMTNVDRIATIALRGSPRAVGGTELRLFDKGPYGTQPAALALSKDGARLYVALAGLNAVAVIDARDPAHLHRLGLIPTGWYPTALALAGDDRTLYVVNTKGFGQDGDAVWSTLQRIDLGAVQLKASTMTALANTRRVGPAAPAYPKAITHVVVVVQAGATFDALLGDLGTPYGDPSLVAYGERVTPNLHALARRYALAANLFADGDGSAAAHQFLTAGISTLYAQRTRPATRSGADPDDAARLGTVFHALARKRLPFRDYGELLDVSGYDAALAPPDGLGGAYRLDVPAPTVLDGHVDLSYPGTNPAIRDERRAGEFVRDYGALVARGAQPRFTCVALPGADGAPGPGLPPHAERVADGDRALGTIVAYLSHLPSWQQTVLIVVPAGAGGSRDHVDPQRTYAIVAGPYAKRGYAGARHLSTAGVLKTTEQILGLGTLSLGDLLATDMTDLFGARGRDAAPYDALPVPEQTGP